MKLLEHAAKLIEHVQELGGCHSFQKQEPAWMTHVAMGIALSFAPASQAACGRWGFRLRQSQVPASCLAHSHCMSGVSGRRCCSWLSSE